MALRLEQVAVLGSLLQKGSVNGVTLFKNLLRGAVLVDQAGNERLGAGILAGSANAVEEVGGDDSADGDVEAALLSEIIGVSKQLHILKDLSELSELVVESSGSASGEEELTPTPSLTGSEWAECEPNRRGVWRSSCRVEAAERLAANMVGWGELARDVW